MYILLLFHHTLYKPHSFNMRSALNIVLALAVFTQATTAAALPKGKPEYGLNRWKHHSKGHGATGTGRTNITIANATRPAGPGKTGFSVTGGTLLPTSIITGDDSTPTDVIVDSNDNNNDDSDDESDDDSDDDESGNTEVIKSPSKTRDSADDTLSFPTLTLPASYKPTGIYNATGSGYGTASLTKTAAGPTTLPSSTPGDIDDEVSSTTKLSPTVSSPPILPTSEAGDDTVITQTVVPIPASTSKIAVASATSTAGSSSGSQWKPAAGATWQIQLHGTVTDINLPVDIYDIDLIESTPSLISSLHANNKKVICYFSAGSFESWRPDAASYTSDDKGSPLEGWENEWWLNTNSANVRTIMKARLDLAKSKGCDGVDPDNVDVYSNSNGKGITKANSLEYLQFLSTETRARGMAMGMKNGLDMVTELLSSMDFHVNESCLEFNECDKLVPFISAGKPVFHIEYPDNAPNIAKNVVDDKCKEKEKGFSSLLKNLELDAWVKTC